MTSSQEREPEARRDRADEVVPPRGLAPERRVPQVGAAARQKLAEIPGPQPVPPWGPAAAQGQGHVQEQGHVQGPGPGVEGAAEPERALRPGPEQGHPPQAREQAQAQAHHQVAHVPQPAGPAFDHADPGAYYRALREAYGPVAPVLLDGGMPAWLVLGYHEVHVVAGNPELFGRDPRRWHAWDRVPAGWPLLPHVAHTPSVRFTEGEEHVRRAGAVADVLGGVDPFELRQRAERAADAAVDAFAGAGRAELVAQYAEQVPLHVMAGLFGLQPAETAALERDLAGQYGYGTAAPGPAAEPSHPAHPVHPAHLAAPAGPAASAARLRATLEAVLARARRAPAPGADIPSRLLAHPAGLTDEEVVQDLLTIMAAGRRPTADWIGNTLRLLLTDERFALTLSGGGAASPRRSRRCCGPIRPCRTSSGGGPPATPSSAGGTSGAATASCSGWPRPTRTPRSARHFPGPPSATTRICRSATAPIAVPRPRPSSRRSSRPRRWRSSSTASPISSPHSPRTSSPGAPPSGNAAPRPSR